VQKNLRDEEVDNLLRGAVKVGPVVDTCLAPAIGNDADLGAYISGGLSPEQRIRLQQHLVECGRCRRRQVALLTQSASPESRPRGRSTVVAMMALAATLTMAILGAQLLWPHAGPPELQNWAIETRGTTAVLRGDPQGKLPHFRADSRVVLTLRPEPLDGERWPLVLRGYRRDSRDALHLVEVAIERRADPDGQVEFQVSASAKEIFTAAGGPQMLLWGFATSPEDLDGLDGSSWHDAPGSPAVVWVEFEADYTP